MNRGDRYANKKVLRLCRSIYNRADNLKILEPLVVELQEVLRVARYETQVIETTAQSDKDDPFDKIMVA